MIFSFGQSGRGNGEFVSPYDIALNPTGDSLWVTDSGNPRVQIFDKNGIFLKSLRTDMVKPAGIAISFSGKVYITDKIEGQINCFSSKGEFLDSWGGNGTDALHWPHGVAINPVDGTVFVVDSGNHRVQHFQSNGALIKTWGEKGTEEGNFIYPEGIVVNKQGMVFVADRGNCRIQSFSSGGEFISAWRHKRLQTPAGLMVDQTGLIWVSDAEEHTIQSFSSAGIRVHFFGGPGLPHGLKTPDGVAIGSDGTIWVADTWHHRIVGFGPDGRQLVSFGKQEGETESLRTPSRIVLDEKDNIVVSDSGNNQVKIFSRYGECLKSFGGYGSGPGEFSDPRGLCFDNDSNLFVVDKGNKRVQIFDSNYDYKGSIEGFFENPEDVAISSVGAVYVADSILNQILKFDSFGNLDAAGYWPVAGFHRPHGLALDDKDNLYITELSEHRIVKLSDVGVQTGIIGERGSFSGQLLFPGGIATGPDGRLFVADSHNHRIQVFAPTQQTFNQKAIIVAGGGAYAGNDLWDATRLSAHQAYSALKNQGFSRNQVRYYSEDVGLDLDNNGLADDVLQPPSISRLEDSVTEWAGDAEWLILYLVNHGTDGRFRLSSRETLSAAQLSRILDRRTGKTLVVIDACQAGSFTSQIKGDNRIVIAGTKETQPAHFIGDGAVSFSGAFWSGLRGGKTVKDAFDEAGTFLMEAGLPQTPVWTSGIDVQGESLLLGYGARLGEKPLLESPRVHIDPGPRRLRLQVDARQESVGGLSRVWAMLRPDSPSPPGPDTPVIDLPTVELPRDPEGSYSAEIDLPHTSRPISAAFFARSADGQTAGPLVDRPVNDDLPRPSAILIQGHAAAPADQNILARKIQTARETLLSRGFAEEDLHLFSPSDGPVLDRLADRLLSIAASDPAEVYLYLVGTGPMSQFPVSPDETLAPDQLAGLAADLASLVLIWDAPHGGESPLAPLSGLNRTLVAGFRRGPLVEPPAFSDLFWTDIGRGLSIGAAYRRAGAFGWESDSAMLDDSGDGRFNTPDDGARAETQYIGTGVRLAAGMSGAPPIFLHGQDFFRIPVEGSALLDEQTRYHAETIPPALFPGSPARSTRSTDPEWLPTDANGVEIDRLGDFGTYRTVLIGTLADGRTIELRRDNLFQNIGGDLYEPDNARSEAKPLTPDAGALQERSIYPEGDVDWIVFGAREDEIFDLEVEALTGEGVLRLEIQDDQNEILKTETFFLRYGEAGWTQNWKVPKSQTGRFYLRIERQDAEGEAEETPFGYGIKLDHQTAPFPGYVRGRVMGPDGHAVGNAWIEIDAGSGTAPGATAVSSPADGRFLIVHPPGTATLTVTADGYDAYSVGIEIPESGEATETIYLEKTAAPPVVVPPPSTVPVVPAPGTIRGRVVDERDNAIGNAKIQIERASGPNGISEYLAAQDGRFQIEQSPGDVRLTATAEGYEPQTVSLRVPQDGRITKEISLSPAQPPVELPLIPDSSSDEAPPSDDFPGLLVGRVTDENGNGIGNAVLEIQSASEKNGANSEGGGAKGVSSPEDGSFQLSHEPGDAILTVAADGYESHSRAVSIPESQIETVTISLAPAKGSNETEADGNQPEDRGDADLPDANPPNPAPKPVPPDNPAKPTPPPTPPESPVNDEGAAPPPDPAPAIPRPPEPDAGTAGGGCFVSSLAG